MRELAISTMRGNDRGGYTVPNPRLYPFQWNWDSALSALGFAAFDRARAWREIETLMSGQWPNGMVPHIIFWRDDEGYFPGKEVWSSGTDPASSCHSQPPVVASVVRQLVATGGPDDLGHARSLFPRLFAYSKWFHDCRDPDGTGVVAITHPWESGRDNSPDWDAPLAAVPVPDDLGDYERRDTDLVDAGQRPTTSQYDRYYALVRHGRSCGWDPVTIHRDGPFLVADPGVQFMLLRADRDLRELAVLLGEDQAAGQLARWVEQSEQGCEVLWNEAVGCYCARDLRGGSFADGISSASMLAWYAGLGDEGRLRTMAANAKKILDGVSYGMPSWDPAHGSFEAKRYWRGPVWAIMNHMIAMGMAERGEDELARRVRGDTRALFEKQGLWEYYDSLTGEGVGGDGFTWTAAIALAWDAKNGREDG